MKRALYSLDDEEFATLLERTDVVLRGKKIPYMVVGGIATQAHIANYLCKKHNKTLFELTHSEEFRMQDHLRATDDVDITLDTRQLGENPRDPKISSTVLEAVKEIEGEGIFSSPTGNHVIAIKLDRTGAKRPIFRLGLDTEADSPDREVSFNFYYSPEDTNSRWSREMVDFEAINYFDFFKSARKLSIPYSAGKIFELIVKGPEQLLSTKIARARPKDWTDILLLFNHSRDSDEPINMSKVEEILSAVDPKYQVANPDLIDRYERFKALVQ